jgi:hypothetical protein
MAQATLSISVDVAANRRPIDPRIYGVNFASQQQLEALNVLLNRSGGNATTRHNWQVNATNRANDWYYQSLDDGSATPAASVDSFVSATRAAGAQPMVTIPTIGWVAKLGPNRGRLSSYSIAKYGAQTGIDSQWFPDAGNGIRASDGSEITWNDPNDANVQVDSTFQQGLVQHLVGRWGAASAGGVRYYILDNEPSLYPRQRAQPLVCNTSRRPQRRPDDGRGPRLLPGLRRQDPAGRPGGADRGARGMGLVGLLL